MGMYTELVIAVELKYDRDMLHILEYLTGKRRIMEVSIPEHKFFKCERWERMLTWDSAYFDGITHSEIEEGWEERTIYLTARCNLKDYDHEIENFLDWISPSILTDGFIGYTRYEEFDYPTLIFCDEEGKIRYEYSGGAE